MTFNIEKLISIGLGCWECDEMLEPYRFKKSEINEMPLNRRVFVCPKCKRKITVWEVR